MATHSCLHEASHPLVVLVVDVEGTRDIRNGALTIQFQIHMSRQFSFGDSVFFPVEEDHTDDVGVASVRRHVQSITPFPIREAQIDATLEQKVNDIMLRALRRNDQATQRIIIG